MANLSSRVKIEHKNSALYCGRFLFDTNIKRRAIYIIYRIYIFIYRVIVNEYSFFEKGNKKKNERSKLTR